MLTAYPDPALLLTIEKLEQSLVTLRGNRQDEALLRIKIEEAIEAGYEVAYSRPSRSRSPGATVLIFSDRRRHRGAA